MHINLSSSGNADDEDYIDFEVISSISSSSSSSHSREFEFQMSANLVETETLASPADELFYKGNLLPLHLPPRLRMVQKLLRGSLDYEEKIESTTTTPFDSCNNTPTSSCRVSGELNPEDLFYECSNEVSTSSIDENSSRSWSNKIKLMKQSSLSLTLEASKAYFKSLFTKTKHPEEIEIQVVQRNEDNGVISKTKEYISKYMKIGKKVPFVQIQREKYQVDANANEENHKEKINEEISSNRRSFSLSLKKHSSTKSTSSSSSSLSSSSSTSSSLSTAHSNGVYELGRSSSAKSEIESSIEGAIAYCKQSQQVICVKEMVSEVGFGSFSSSRVAVCETQERPGLCRG